MPMHGLPQKKSFIIEVTGKFWATTILDEIFTTFYWKLLPLPLVNSGPCIIKLFTAVVSFVLP